MFNLAFEREMSTPVRQTKKIGSTVQLDSTTYTTITQGVTSTWLVLLCGSNHCSTPDWYREAGKAPECLFHTRHKLRETFRAGLTRNYRFHSCCSRSAAIFLLGGTADSAWAHWCGLVTQTALAHQR